MHNHLIFGKKRINLIRKLSTASYIHAIIKVIIYDEKYKIMIKPPLYFTALNYIGIIMNKLVSTLFVITLSLSSSAIFAATNATNNEMTKNPQLSDIPP